MQKVSVLALICCLVVLWAAIVQGSELGGCNLELGVRGTDVFALQARLFTLGFDPGPCDGIFGPNTQVAVRQLQFQRGLTVSGIVDSETLGASQLFVYKVQVGDTLMELAERFQIAPIAIASLNQLRDGDDLQVGQQLKLPIGLIRRDSAQYRVSRGADRQTTVGRGQLLRWPEVNELVPRGSIITITDVTSGQSLQAQRRGGTKHMDVEPLTADDTAALKAIYGGSWSWERRAMLVQVGDIIIAASGNGMPHGSSKIGNNGFPGHFCLHFLDSTTHGTGEVDPDHQAAIRRAAVDIGSQLSVIGS